MISVRVSILVIGVLIAVRAMMAALLPLSADEAYYWLWSLHPAWGYFDHPPMIAWLIRMGTLMFGDTPFGVRLAGLVLSLPASWFVWKGADLLLKDRARAALAALLFNLTLMASVEMLAATPDMPSILTGAAFFCFLIHVQRSGDGRWWLAAGAAAGLGLLSKYSALFLGAGALVWLVVDGKARAWLRSPWPFLGAGLALAIAAPHILWQSQHQWQTFAFQFGRVGGGHLTLRFLGEFVAAQIGLASPLIFVLMLVGLWRATARAGSDRLVLAAPVLVALAYFLVHALHDRVQGNWPCFLYPALAILAADAFATEGAWRKVSFVAAPLAAVLLLAVYVQALAAPVPIRKDPLARILGRDFRPVADVTGAMARAHLADAILTTDYETTAWLRFTQPGLKVVQVNEPRRYPQAPAADKRLLSGRLLYLAELRRDQHQLVQQSFGYMGFPTQMQAPGALYMLYPVGRPKVSSLGKMP
ncbi:MAG TPA: glycosyltransferase family 39 protein [Rhizomicrobium sp.]|nr:glycosyltransferase family 39 protein [Rhizomicrobium sp.]